MSFGDTIEGILDRCERAIPRWAGILGEIMEDVARLEHGLVDMKMECLRLEAAGMWPAVPTEMWEERNGGDKIYLRLYFPQGTPSSLGVRGKTYIGCKPEAIADSRRKTANRQRWEELDEEIGRLERTLRGVEVRLEREGAGLGRYRLLDLGTTAAARGTAVVPKMEVER